MTYFFEHDLPLPIARAVQPSRLAGPLAVRETVAAVAVLARDLGGCRLAPHERDALPVPRVPTGEGWVLKRRHELLQATAKLQRQLKHYHPSETLVELPLAMLDEALARVDPCRDPAQHLQWSCDLGRLLAAVFMTRGLQRVEAAARTRGVELPREPPRQDPPSAAGRDAPTPGERPPVDVAALAGRVRPERLNAVHLELYKQAEALNLPILWTVPGMKEEVREPRERTHEWLRKAAEPRAAERTRLCLAELYPAEPWLPEASGVTAEALAYLLEWDDALAALGELAAQIMEEVEDTEQVLWAFGRGAIKTLFHEVAVAADPKTFEGSLVLTTLIGAANDLRARPRGDTLWDGIHGNRDRYDAHWRSLLGGGPPWAT